MNGGPWAFKGIMKEQEYLKNVVTLKLDTEKCIGCGMCVEVCPHGVFEIKEHKAVIVNKDACMECGACEKNCPANAIAVRSGVGCAFGIINGLLKGSDKPCCGGPPTPKIDVSDLKQNSCCAKKNIY